ncbi:Serine protease family S33 [Phytophthora palmivora]|uniref:Serine protease family S33 n=1 Tax=Phytophthora palmivora TaxID=4796 RepID=A0A2P4XDA0_9STRA|nr:Serine protease family S33 [Phytophthora palmivora]
MLARFTGVTISNGGNYAKVATYCAFTKENSTVCNDLDVGSYHASGIAYEPDEYWNQSATIPAQASVLLLSGKLDPQTPHKYAEYLLGALDGDKKELITFDYATHGTLTTTPMVDGDDSGETCGMKILISYVSSNGDLDRLDKTCVSEMPAFNLTIPIEYLQSYLSVDDAYDGVYDASLSSSGSLDTSVSSTSKGSSKYKAVFITFLALFVMAVVIAGFILYRWTKLKKDKTGAKGASNENNETSELPLDIFVKRVPAVSDSETATNVWFMQGGPGASSTAMESAMVELHTRLDGAVNVYTMDHRGTGRSTLLDCVAAQVTTTGSPWGSAIESTEVPACAQALEKKYGNLSSFSMTSAAMDVATFISDYSNGANTIVYAVSYGTALVERVIHLDPPNVVGYVLDGVATSSGTTKEFEYFSTWDTDFGDVGDAFMALCATQSECSERYVTKTLPVTLQSLITQLDNNERSTCAALVSELNSDQSSIPPSYILRRVLGVLLQSTKMRTLIPPIVYRLNRCASKDIDVLTHFFTYLNHYLSLPNEDDAFESTLLYYLIVFSEMWETPEPPIAEMLARFTDARISNGGTYSDIPQYCAFSKERSTVCDQLDVGTYDANGIIYERDEYWNKSATIPSQASVLLLSSKLDPQTPHKYAEYLLKALDGDKKELITFEYATHGTLWTTPLDQGDEDSETCGMKLLISYVTNNGDLDGLDKSCVDMMPALNMTPPLAYQYYFLSTDNAYDGVYDASLADQVARSSSSLTGSSNVVLGATSQDNSTYKVVFIVFLVLFVTALTLACFFAYRWYKLKHEKTRNRVTDDIEISSAADVVSSSPELTTSFSTQGAK